MKMRDEEVRIEKKKRIRKRAAVALSSLYEVWQKYSPYFELSPV